MTNDISFLVRPTKEIKYLLKLRGSNLKKIAEKTGCSYTVLSKFLSNTETIDKRARHYHKSPHIYNALAETIGITESELMDKKALLKLIDAELQKIRDAELAKKKKYFRRCLNGGYQRWSLKRFIKNLIRLGQPGYYEYNHYMKYED